MSSKGYVTLLVSESNSELSVWQLRSERTGEDFELRSRALRRNGMELTGCTRGSCGHLLSPFPPPLRTIETMLRQAAECVQTRTLDLCLGFGIIASKQLYIAEGFTSFRAYILSTRLDINYKTAMNYATIGVALIKFKQELSKVGYQPEIDGFNKLRLLERAIATHAHNTAAVFEYLKKTSYRAFRRFNRPRWAKGCFREVAMILAPCVLPH